MDLEKRFDLIKRNTQEIVTEEELKKLMKEKKNPQCIWELRLLEHRTLDILFGF